MRPVLLRLLPLLLALPATAQVPSTDIFLLDFAEVDGQINLGTPHNLTDREGYDNQPAFTHDGSALLYTSQRGEQTDIYRYDLATKQHDQLTHTATSEYSPIVMPGGERFSVVMVEADSTQRLWSFLLDGSAPLIVLSDVQPVGYHAWHDSATVALFVLGEPPTLWIGNPQTQAVWEGPKSIGRSLHRRPGATTFSFAQKTSESEWWIKELSPKDLTTTPLIETRLGREDYCWTPGGTILMPDASSVWAWQPGDEGWRQVADLGEGGLSDITRCAVSPDGRYLALVANPL